MVRLFVGLELSQDIKSALNFARSGVEGARWQTDDQLHITLAFLGEIDPGMVSHVENALSRITFEPFDLRLAGVNMFGTQQHPKTLWAGVEIEENLRLLHNKIRRALACIDIETDNRRYKPHVTLARFSRGAEAHITNWLSDNSLLKTPLQKVGYFSLFSSHLTAEGPQYLVEARFGEMSNAADFDRVEPVDQLEAKAF